MSWFIFKKIVSAVLMPPVLSILLAFAGLWIARWHRRTGLILAVLSLLSVLVLSWPPVSDALVIMLEAGFRHLPIVDADRRILGVFSLRDALPRELGNAMSQAEFNEQVNDALG